VVYTWVFCCCCFSQNIGASCSAQHVSVDGEILSGPDAFLIFSFVKRFFTCYGRTLKGGGGRPESESGGTACVGPEWLEALVVFFPSNLLYQVIQLIWEGGDTVCRC